jgi:hypothetical protein
MRWTDGDIASGPDKQWCIREERDNHCGPDPDILTGELFCTIAIPDPAPILFVNMSWKSNSVEHEEGLHHRDFHRH